MDMVIQDKIVDLLEQERYFEAGTLLDRYLRLEGKDEFYYLAASDIRLGMEDYDHVVSLLDEAMDTGIQGPLVWERLADALVGLEDYETARDWLERVLNSGDLEDADEPRVMFDLGRCAVALQDYPAAVQYFEDILLEEDNPETRFLLAMSYGELGNYVRMNDIFQQLIVDPDYTERILEYLIYQEDPGLLTDYLDAMDVSDVQRLAALAQHWMTNGDLEEAARTMECLYREDGNPDSLAAAALFAGQQGLTAYSRRLFRELMNLGPAEGEDLLGYALIRLEALEVQEYAPCTVKNHVMRILEAAGNEPDVVIQAARFCLNNDLARMAHTLLQNMPRDLNCQQSLAWCHLRSMVCLQIEEYQEAYRCLKDHKGEKDRMYRKNLAIASYCTGRAPEALRESLAILPDGIGAIIAFLIYDERGEQDKAAGVIHQMQKALAKEEPIEDLSNFIGFLEEIAEKTAA